MINKQEFKVSFLIIVLQKLRRKKDKELRDMNLMDYVKRLIKKLSGTK